MARLNVLENSPTQWTITKEAGLKGALQDGTTGINTNALEVQGVAITATPSELNILDGATLSTVELNYVDGVTSSIQSQIDNKADDSSLTSHTGDSTIHFTQGSISIPASQISDFDTEVSNNSSVIANTAKVTNATHTGEVTGSTALTIADNVVDEANLKLDTAPTNDYVLTADSTASGGMKWAASASGFSDPMTTRGDIIYRNSSNSTTRLAAGTNGQVLTSDGTDISWQDVSVSSNTMGTVVHGSTASTARPSGYTVVTWIGSVEPTNATNNDVWIDTT